MLLNFYTTKSHLKTFQKLFPESSRSRDKLFSYITVDVKDPVLLLLLVPLLLLLLLVPLLLAPIKAALTDQKKVLKSESIFMGKSRASVIVEGGGIWWM